MLLDSVHPSPQDPGDRCGSLPNPSPLRLPSDMDPLEVSIPSTEMVADNVLSAESDDFAFWFNAL